MNTKELKKYRWVLILLCIFTIISLILDLVFPYIDGKFIDCLISDKNFSKILEMISIIFILGFINYILKYFIKCKSKELKEYISYDFKKNILNHLRKISILDYNKYNSSYLNKRIEQDTIQIVTFFIDNYIAFFVKLVQFIIIISILFKININIAIITLVTCPLYYLIYKYFRKSMFEESLIAREKTAVFFKVFNNQLEYMEDILIEANYDIQDNILKSQFLSYFDSTMIYTKTAAKFNFAQGIFALGFQIVVFLCSGYYVLNNQMTVGELTIITTYFSIVRSIISYYVEFGKVYQISKSSLARIKELLNIQISSEGEIEIMEIDKVDAILNFSYDENQYTLSNLNINAKKGDVVGIIGTNGSGKTTASKLIIGSIKSNTEKMEVVFNDKYNINTLDTILLRNKNVSYIPQKIRYVNISICDIFNELGVFTDYNSVINNLIDKGIILTESIKEFLINCWNKRIDELSGGDKQLVVILKNLIKDTDMIILDEPSSNLDKERILWLKHTINSIKVNKIIIIITHDDNMLDVLDKKIDTSKVYKNLELQND